MSESSFRSWSVGFAGTIIWGLQRLTENFRRGDAGVDAIFHAKCLIKRRLEAKIQYWYFALHFRHAPLSYTKKSFNGVLVLDCCREIL